MWAKKIFYIIVQNMQLCISTNTRQLIFIPEYAIATSIIKRRRISTANLCQQIFPGLPFEIFYVYTYYICDHSSAIIFLWMVFMCTTHMRQSYTLIATSTNIQYCFGTCIVIPQQQSYYSKSQRSPPPPPQQSSLHINVWRTWVFVLLSCVCFV